MYTQRVPLIAKSPAGSYELHKSEVFENRIPQLLTVRELAPMLRVSELTLRKWVQRGVIPVVCPHPRVVRFNAEVIEKWLSERTRYNA